MTVYKIYYNQEEVSTLITSDYAEVQHLISMLAKNFDEPTTDNFTAVPQRDN